MADAPAPPPPPTLADRLGALLGPRLAGAETGRDMATLTARPDLVHEALQRLRDDRSWRFELLVDLTAVDYLGYPAGRPGRFAVVYHLHSLRLEERVRVQAFLPAESPEIASASDLWGNAEWLEREVYDLYGIRFTGHPDLRRILMPDDYLGHPLRKDYPLRGRGERDSFPEVQA